MAMQRFEQGNREKRGAMESAPFALHYYFTPACWAETRALSLRLPVGL